MIHRARRSTPARRLTLGLVGLLAAAGLLACQADGDDGTDASPLGGDAVQVTAKDFEFEVPEAISSGWSTFRFANEGEQEHFFLLWRLPEDKTFSDYRTGVADAFVRVWDRYASGELDRAETEKALGAELPAWFFEEVVASGGAALTEPGDTSQVTLRLEPGSYVMECYVKTPQGTWHTDRGMLHGLTVTDSTGGTPEPEADARLTLSNYEIAVSGELGPGTHTVAVRVKDRPDGFMPHDINLIRLDGEADVREVVAWMDWMELGQFRSPAPGYSLGGVEHLPPGRTGYMTVELEPGEYAWVSEGYGARGMVKEFTVE